MSPYRSTLVKQCRFVLTRKKITLNRNGVKVEESYPKQIYLEDLVVGEYKNVLILNRGWKENILVDVFAGLAIKALARNKSSCLLPNHQLAIPALIPTCPLNKTSKGNVFIQLHQRVISWWFQTSPMN